MSAPPLEVSGLRVSIGGRPLLHDLSFALAPGERLGFIGGSGSGKTVTALAIAGLLPEDAEVRGSIRLGDRELVGLGERELSEIRGDLIGTVFQEPKTALNPLRRLGRQMTEALSVHYNLSRAERRAAALRLAERVGLGEPERMVRAYPHEVSGGQRQRAAIAAAVSADPVLLLADEPTTALDVTVQRGILRLFRDLTEGDGCSLVFISHDLAVVSDVTERVLVFAEGRIVEEGPVSEILDAPRHPVTRALVDAARSPALQAPAPPLPAPNPASPARSPSRALLPPSPWQDPESETRIPVNPPTKPAFASPISDAGGGARASGAAGAALVEARDLTKRYRVTATKVFEGAGETTALDGVDLAVERGQSLAIVGESGSGKSTLLRLLLGLSRPTAGEVRFDGRTVDPARDRLLWLRRRTGIVLQDPYASFDPRRTIGQTVAEPLVATSAAGDHRLAVREILDRLELPGDAADRYPYEFSGGQRQRIALARALVHRPDLLLADEPVSALDVLVRGRLLDLLAGLHREFGLTLVTVTHDLSIVPRLAERIAVMREGRVIEQGPTSEILAAPRDPYTRELIAALPRLPE
ncbi:ABC transporter ATP-binding protein [Leucobacter weissii]|uniref:ABC transporter ATP-binding protein n=1 Tax=Leucobacter weissii TaxID=1983706 RepID=A0A939MH61_9MICO|nr:ABC transporter ATP-binding protein [Leucobacter weissii]MBO1900839.1 ABC transporter ATP-binding protein [Leucobacter weissii]